MGDIAAHKVVCHLCALFFQNIFCFFDISDHPVLSVSEISSDSAEISVFCTKKFSVHMDRMPLGIKSCIIMLPASDFFWCYVTNITLLTQGAPVLPLSPFHSQPTPRCGLVRTWPPSLPTTYLRSEIWRHYWGSRRGSVSLRVGVGKKSWNKNENRTNVRDVKAIVMQFMLLFSYKVTTHWEKITGLENIIV